MKSYSYNFILKGKSSYKDLVPVFPDILKMILMENDHFQSEEDEENREMFIELNMVDLLADRKPEGYNRKGKYRLIFPIGSKSFYIRTFSGKPNEMKRIGEEVTNILSTVKGLSFDVKRDDIEYD